MGGEALGAEEREGAAAPSHRWKGFGGGAASPASGEERGMPPFHNVF